MIVLEEAMRRRAEPRHCLVEDCRADAVARGLCRTHYDGHRRKRPGWHNPRRDLDDETEREVAWCECETPVWQSCAPFFPSVRQCAMCGSPDRRQLGVALSDATTKENP